MKIKLELIGKFIFLFLKNFPSVGEKWHMGHALFRLWGERCVGYFAVVMMRYPDQKRLKEERVYFSWHFWRF